MLSTENQAKIMTKLVLEIGSLTNTYSWIIGELPYNPNQYRFSVSKGYFVARYTGFCFGGLLKWSGALNVTDIALGRVTTLTQDIWIRPWYATAVAGLVNSENYHALLTVMNDDLSISEIIVLKEASLPTRPTLSLEDIRQLYPRLTGLPSAPLN